MVLERTQADGRFDGYYPDVPANVHHSTWLVRSRARPVGDAARRSGPGADMTERQFALRCAYSPGQPVDAMKPMINARERLLQSCICPKEYPQDAAEEIDHESGVILAHTIFRKEFSIDTG